MDLSKTILAYRQEIIPDLEGQIAKETNVNTKEGLEKLLISIRKDLRSKEIQQRLLLQYSRGEYIEYLCLMSQLVEFHVEENIYSLIQFFSLEKKDIKFLKDWESKPLGVLIGILENYVDDPGFLRYLKEFNILRKKAIHKLFSIDFEIVEVLREIQSNFHPNIVYSKIVNILMVYNTGVLTKVGKIKGTFPQTEKLLKMLEKELDVRFEDVGNRIKI